MTIRSEITARLAREHREERDVLRRIEAWADRGGRTVAQLAAGLEWPGGAIGVPPVLRRLAEQGRAHERDGTWFPGPAVEDLEDRSSADPEVVTAPGLETAGFPSSTTGTTPNGAGEDGGNASPVGGERASSPDTGAAAVPDLPANTPQEEDPMLLATCTLERPLSTAAKLAGLVVERPGLTMAEASERLEVTTSRIRQLTRELGIRTESDGAGPKALLRLYPAPPVDAPAPTRPELEEVRRIGVDEGHRSADQAWRQGHEAAPESEPPTGPPGSVFALWWSRGRASRWAHERVTELDREAGQLATALEAAKARCEELEVALAGVRRALDDARAEREEARGGRDAAARFAADAQGTIARLEAELAASQEQASFDPDELAKVRAIVYERNDLLVERDALLLERDQLREDLDVVKAELVEATGEPPELAAAFHAGILRRRHEQALEDLAGADPNVARLAEELCAAGGDDLGADYPLAVRLAYLLGRAARRAT